MRVIAYGDIMDRGSSVFTSVATIDESDLKVTFSGMIRVDSPYRHLEGYMQELKANLQQIKADSVEFDFRELSFCNSNGFYVIMDIVEMIANQYSCPIVVKRLRVDDWHQETLPILVNADDSAIAARLQFEDHDEV